MKEQIQARLERGYTMAIYGTRENIHEQMTNDIKELLEAINYNASSSQLKEKEIPTFEDWINFNGYRKEYTDLVDNGFAYDIGVLYRKYTQAIKQPLIV